MPGKNEILFIDDEESIRLLAVRFLEDGNVSVSTLSDGNDAARIVKSRRPSLVFLDLKLPGKDGLQVLKEIKAAAPRLPVVMVSGHMNSAHAEEASRLGACDYVFKPVDWDYVRRAMPVYTLLGTAPDELEILPNDEPSK
jgi:DNA-binding NtrC family response regulator